MTRNVTLGFMSILLVAVLTWVVRNEQQVSDELKQIPIDTTVQETNGLVTHPLLQMSNEIDQEELSKSLECIDEFGDLTCGIHAGESALLYSVLGRRHTVLESLAQQDILQKSGLGAMTAAVAIGNMEAFRFLFEKGRALGVFEDVQDVYFSTPDLGYHPMLAAAEYGNREVFVHFLNEGLNINSFRLDDGSDLFGRAIGGNQYDIVRLMIASGYTVDCKYRYPNGRSYHEVAQSLGSQSLVDIIADTCKS